MKRFEIRSALGGGAIATRWESLTARKTAFTLAEVLITLGIIGVVAAMTLPTLIQQHQKQVYVTQLKKSLSTVQNMVTKITADEGASDLFSTSLFDGMYASGTENWQDGYGDVSGLDNIIPKYIKTVKICSNRECDIEYGYASSPNGGKEIISSLSGGMYPVGGRLKGYYGNDGAIYYFGYVGYFTNVIEQNSTGLLTCIDVNGEKGPNLKDRDLFCYTYCPNLGEKIMSGSQYVCKYPDWAKDTKEYRLMTNGWKMDY